MERLGRYELLKELGRGAMGVVYQARDPQIDRLVAIKLLSAPEAPPPGRPTSPGETAADVLREWRERFRREAQAAGRLSHPNVVAIHDVGEDRGQPYLVMEFVEGESLDALLRRRRVLPVDEAVSIGAQVAEALGHAHQHGIIHRDVKPANIMLRADGVVKVADFGIARLSGADVTQTGRILGSPSYMSPEQVSGLKVDGRSDLFSLGTVLYEMLTGEKAFHGETISTITYRIVHEEPTPLRRLNPAFSGKLDACLRRAMAKDPAQRYARAADLLLELRGPEKSMAARAPTGETAQQLPVPPPPGAPRPVPPLPPSRGRRPVPPPRTEPLHLGAWITIGLTGIALGFAALAMFRAARVQVPAPPPVASAPPAAAPATPPAPAVTPPHQDADRLAVERRRIEEERARLAAEQQRLEAERKQVQELQASRKSSEAVPPRPAPPSQPIAPPAPSASAAPPPAPAPPAPPPASGPVRFIGNTVIATEELDGLASRAVGQKGMRDDLRHLAGRVTELYISRGYVLARAIPQPVRGADGLPEIEIHEGRLGSLRIQDLSLRQAQAVQEVFAPVLAKGVFEKSAAESALKTLSEQHDLMVRLSFERGSGAGTVNLMVTRLTSGRSTIETPTDPQRPAGPAGGESPPQPTYTPPAASKAPAGTQRWPQPQPPVRR
jgi:serine/threonine-protein kinase